MEPGGANPGVEPGGANPGWSRVEPEWSRVELGGATLGWSWVEPSWLILIGQYCVLCYDWFSLLLCICLI